MIIFQGVEGALMFSEVASVWGIGFETQEATPSILKKFIYGALAKYSVEKAAALESLQPSTICPAYFFSSK